MWILQKCNQNKQLELFYKKIGENVKNIRIEKGFSQLKLANTMGYDSVGHIAKAEIYKYDKKYSVNGCLNRTPIFSFFPNRWIDIFCQESTDLNDSSILV